MRERRRLILLLAVAVLATACEGSGETVETAAPGVASGSSVPASTEPTADSSAEGSDVDLFEVFGDLGIEIIDDPAEVAVVDGFQVWSFQVENMQQEIAVGDGLFGTELDRLVGAPGGMPFSYLVAGWITGAGTPAAAAAAEIMGDQQWEFAPSLIYPNAVLMLMVADSLRAQGAIGAAAAGSLTVQQGGVLLDAVGPVHAAEEGGLCTKLSNWVDGVVNWIFDKFTIGIEGDEWYEWAARVWNAAVEWARDKVKGAIEVATDVLLDPIRRVLAAAGSVSMVVTHLKRWEVQIVVPPQAPELAVGDEPDVIETALVQVETGLQKPWPDLVDDCASVAGVPLPDPSKTQGSNVEWAFGESFPAKLKDGARIDDSKTDEQVGEDNTAILKWSPGRDEEGFPYPGLMELTVTVEKNQIEELKDLLWTFVTGATKEAVGTGHLNTVSEILAPFVGSAEEAIDELARVLDVSDRETVVVLYHNETDFVYDYEDLVPDLLDQDETGDDLIRIDIGRATDTNENIMAAGDIDMGPFTGHPEFTIWVAPSPNHCQLRTGVAFESNPADCTFTVGDGPEFLVGKVLTADDRNGTLFYGWDGDDKVDEMLDFVGITEPRCLDLSWYIRIFETGVMLGYPQGLMRINDIDFGGPDCVALAMSNTTEYTTTR